MRPRITVVGSINIDLVFCTPRMPMVGETIEARGFRQIPGGKGANQAVAAARQGADVHFVGAVGTDSFGQQALQALGAEGICIERVAAVGVPSGVAGIFVDDAGANSIVFAAGANALLTVERVEEARAAIERAQFLVCQLESPLESVTRAIEIAHRHGVKVVFNPSPARAFDAALLRMVDVLVVNETEAEQLSGIAVRGRAGAAAAARVLLERGAAAVLLTMGEHGVTIVTAGREHFIPAVKVEAVDTTAAGDTFVGACTAALARGMPLDQAVTEAQYAAALAVTRIGAQTSIPTREEVARLMSSTQ